MPAFYFETSGTHSLRSVGSAGVQRSDWAAQIMKQIGQSLAEIFAAGPADDRDPTGADQQKAAPACAVRAATSGGRYMPAIR